MPEPTTSRREILAAALGGGLLGLTACGGPDPKHVVVYTALDRDFSQPLLRRHEAQSGVEVRAIYDVESTKSFGLARRIETERKSPICDLFWNNEIINTIRLQRKGLLEPFHPAGGDAIPQPFRNPDGLWYGFAARARVLLVNTEAVASDDTPTTTRDLLQPRWNGKLAIAKPLFGTTGTHAACLFAQWGEVEAQAFFLALKASGVQVVSGNRQVASEVAAGRAHLGLTDTDDALQELAAGSPVKIVYLDREPGALGTLFIPNTLARIKNCPHPVEADQLAAFLLSPVVETALATGPSGQIPLNPAVDVSTQVETPRTVRSMNPDFEKAADLWEPVVAPFLAATFGAAD